MGDPRFHKPRRWNRLIFIFCHLKSTPMLTTPNAVVFALIAMFASVSSAAQDASQAAHSAAILAHTHKLQVQKGLHDCASVFSKTRGEFFGFVEAFWVNTNHSMDLAAAQLWPSVPKAQRQAASDFQQVGALPTMASFDEADPQMKLRLCNALAKQADNGTLDFATAYPPEANILQEFLGVEKTRITNRNADFTTGCMKTQWNIGNRDLQSVKASCECQTAVMLRSATEAELDSFVTEIGTNPGGLSSLAERTPWLVAAAPAIAACRAEK